MCVIQYINIINVSNVNTCILILWNNVIMSIIIQ